MGYSFSGINWMHIHRDELKSSNDFIRTLPAFGKENLLLTCRYQSHGKGQEQNTWHSGKGENLLMSLSFDPKLKDASQQFAISIAVSLAVYKSLRAFLPNNSALSVKWPNDIYAGNRKIGGILIENQVIGMEIKQCIAGIGLNVNQLSFPEYIPNPVSMAQLAKKAFQLDEVLAVLMQDFSARLHELREQRYDGQKQHYLSALYRREGYWPFLYHNEKIIARIAGIDNFGQLLLETESAQQLTAAQKEVSFISEY